MASAEAVRAELGGEDFPDQTIDQDVINALGGQRNWVLIGSPYARPTPSWGALVGPLMHPRVLFALPL